MPRTEHCDVEVHGSPTRMPTGVHFWLMHADPVEHKVQPDDPQLPANTPGLQRSVLQQPVQVVGLHGFERQSPKEQEPPG